MINDTLLTSHVAFVQKIAQLEAAVTRCQILGKPLFKRSRVLTRHSTHQIQVFTSNYLIAVAHDVMGGHQRLENDDPVGVLRAFDQQVGQLRNRHVGLIRAVYQICENPIMVD